MDNGVFTRKEFRGVWDIENCDDEVAMCYRYLRKYFKYEDDCEYLIFKTTNKYQFINAPRTKLIPVDTDKTILQNIIDKKLLRKNVKYVIKRKFLYDLKVEHTYYRIN